MRLPSPQLGQGKQTGQCDMCWSGSRDTWILVPTLLPSVSASQESTFFNPGFSHSILKRKRLDQWFSDHVPWDLGDLWLCFWAMVGWGQVEEGEERKNVHPHCNRNSPFMGFVYWILSIQFHLNKRFCCKMELGNLWPK